MTPTTTNDIRQNIEAYAEHHRLQAEQHRATARRKRGCPDCGGPVSSSIEDFYCAELCGWSQARRS